jgi:hypothetical protein
MPVDGELVTTSCMCAEVRTMLKPLVADQTGAVQLVCFAIWGIDESFLQKNF